MIHNTVSNDNSTSIQAQQFQNMLKSK